MSIELLDDLHYLNKEPQEFVYVGFGKRAVAVILDVLIFYLIMTALVVIALLMNNFMPKEIIEYFQLMISFIILFLYVPLFEGSSYQGTPGKLAMKIKIVDLNGGRISYGKAFARFASKFLSYLILFIGFIMAAFTEKKQGLHDILVKTYVVEKNNT